MNFLLFPFPWMQRAMLISESCILYADWQPQWEASWPDFPSSTKGTCCVKGFATVSQPSKCLASCCRLLMGPKLVTREISSIQSFPNVG